MYIPLNGSMLLHVQCGHVSREGSIKVNTEAMIELQRDHIYGIEASFSRVMYRTQLCMTQCVYLHY